MSYQNEDILEKLATVFKGASRYGILHRVPNTEGVSTDIVIAPNEFLKQTIDLKNHFIDYPKKVEDGTLVNDTTFLLGTAGAPYSKGPYAHCTSLEEAIVSVPFPYLFEGCTNLKNVSVVEVYPSSQDITHTIGTYTYGADLLARAAGSGGNSFVFGKNGSAYSYNADSTSSIVSKGLFKDCTSLKFINLSCLDGSDSYRDNIPESICEGCTNLSQVVINENLQIINRKAFKDTALTSATLPTKCRYFDDTFPTGCTVTGGVLLNMDRLTVGTSSAGVTNGVVGDGSTSPYNNYSSVSSYHPMYLTIDEGITEVSNYSFTGQTCESISLPSTLTTIGWSAFARCEFLKGATIPTNVQTLGLNSFANCPNFKRVLFYVNGQTNSDPQITIIPQGCFKNSPLKWIEIPDSVTIIGKEAFAGETEMQIPRYSSDINNVTEIKEGAFREKIVGQYVESGSRFVLGATIDWSNSSVTKIEQYVFTDCVGLNDVYLPSGCQYHMDAFLRCKKADGTTATVIHGGTMVSSFS